MTPPLIWWALKNPKGEIMVETIAERKATAAFKVSWNPNISKPIAKRGYKFCRVRIEEVR